jgi:uncharacterized protein
MCVKRIFRFVVVVLLIALAGIAQAQSPGPAVWEVRGGESSLSIMGSVHLLKPDTDWLRPEVERRFDEASVLVLEVAGMQQAEAVMVRMVREKGFYPPKKSLADELDRDLYDRVLAQAENLGADRKEFARMRPWLASIVLTQLWAAGQGYDSGHGVDIYFNHRASAAGKPVAGLESVEDQLDMLIEGLGDDGATTLEQTLVQLEYGDYVDALISAWLAGDLDTLEQLIVEGFADADDAYEVLMAARNRTWVERLETMLATPGSEFVVVGAGHLVGPANVLELLEERGYTVIRQ